jgi:urease accessory protein
VLLYTFMVSFLGAALRLGSIGHREAQRILLSLRPRLSSLLDMVWERDLDEIGAFAPLADIRAMQHAYLPVRLFSS